VGRLTCPYCYETFKEREIKFRCTGRLSRSEKTCPAERDQQLALRIGRSTLLPPVFEARGQDLRATCPTCGDVTSYRVCPACHSTLPVQFGKFNSRLIAMVGAKQSGKTVYMTVLLHELAHTVGQRFDAAVVGADDDTRTKFTARYEHRLYREGALFGTTVSAGTRGGIVEPLVFRFTTERTGLLGSKSQHVLLSFFDAAGEDLNARERVDANARYLANADGIVLLLDPLQMSAARSLAKDGPKPDEQGTDDPLHVLTRITELLKARLALKPSARIGTPIAVAFTKLDALWHTFPPESPLHGEAREIAAFDELDSRDVHAHIQALLHEWGGLQIDQVLRLDYARYRYFGFSALGEVPTKDQRVAAVGIHPRRVADPFLWLLSEFGAIPTAKA